MREKLEKYHFILVFFTTKKKHYKAWQKMFKKTISLLRKIYFHNLTFYKYILTKIEGQKYKNHFILGHSLCVLALSMTLINQSYYP